MSKKPKKQRQSSNRKKRTHHPTIYESESIPPIGSSGAPALKDVGSFEEFSAETQTLRFEDIGWIGGKHADRPGMTATIFKMIESDLTFYSALDLILLGIIRAHPAKTPPSTKGSPIMRPDEQRLGAARKALTGKKSKSGRHNLADAESVCTRAAYQYARLSMGFDKEIEDQHLWPILKKILAPRLKGKPKKEQDDIITPYKNFFRKHQIRLMVKVTWYASEEQKTRRFHLARVVQSLMALGIAVDLDFIREQIQVPQPDQP